jgi:uncharacterized protein YlzI (FlbEa/FlbD family)
MLVQLEPNLIVNPDKIEYIKKYSDRQIVLYMSSGDNVRVNMSLHEFNLKLNSYEDTVQLLNEDA